MHTLRYTHLMYTSWYTHLMYTSCLYLSGYPGYTSVFGRIREG